MLRNAFQNKKIAFVIAVYWLLLLYVLAALFWWFIALNRQNAKMTELKFSTIQKDSKDYNAQVNAIYFTQQRKKAQYVGEGVAFFAIIILAAYFVFRATLRHLKFTQQQQNFMMAVTHELKTPISIVRLNVETLQRRQLKVEHKEKILADTLMETDRLNNLCNNILVTSQLETGKYHCLKEPIDMKEMLEQVSQEFQHRFPDRNINFHSTEDNVVLQGEVLLIQLLLSNLIENAVKYSFKGAIIDLALKTKSNKIILSVADNGPGVQDEEKKLVFDKFYRTGDENKRKTKGTGLGLYLCKKIVQSHNGTISVSDNQPQGAIFTVIFTT